MRRTVVSQSRSSHLCYDGSVVPSILFIREHGYPSIIYTQLPYGGTLTRDDFYILLPNKRKLLGTLGVPNDVVVPWS